LKTLIVTSYTTFLPGNYDDVIIGLAQCPHVHGLVVLDNSSFSHIWTGLALIGLGARRMGLNLVGNNFGASHRRRLHAYLAAGKQVWTMSSVNSPESLGLVVAEGIDLILNARTRCIYKEPILSAPRLGCINIHHGLLPEQRGTMCDLWALAEGEAAGFTLHKMTAKIDAGQILARVPVSRPGDLDYQAYLRRAMGLELAATTSLLAELAASGACATIANHATGARPHRRNPPAAAVRHMIRKGMIL